MDHQIARSKGLYPSLIEGDRFIWETHRLLRETNGRLEPSEKFVYAISHSSANGQAPVCLNAPSEREIWQLHSQKALPLLRQGRLRKHFFVLSAVYHLYTILVDFGSLN